MHHPTILIFSLLRQKGEESAQCYTWVAEETFFRISSAAGPAWVLLDVDEEVEAGGWWCFLNLLGMPEQSAGHQGALCIPNAVTGHCTTSLMLFSECMFQHLCCKIYQNYAFPFQPFSVSIQISLSAVGVHNQCPKQEGRPIK